MQLKLFIMPVKNLAAAEAEMDAFQRGHRVLAVKKEFVETVQQLGLAQGRGLRDPLLVLEQFDDDEPRTVERDHRVVQEAFPPSRVPVQEQGEKDTGVNDDAGRVHSAPSPEKRFSLAFHQSALISSDNCHAASGVSLLRRTMLSTRSQETKPLTSSWVSPSVGMVTCRRSCSAFTAIMGQRYTIQTGVSKADQRPGPASLAFGFLPLAFSLLFLAFALTATADDLIVTNETPAFVLDTRLPSDTASSNSLIVQAESPPFALDTRLPSGEPPGGSLLVQAESPPFTLDTRLPNGVVPSSGTVVAESGPFTLDTRMPAGISPEGSVVIAESPPFTLDTRLPDGTSFTNAVVIAESPPFSLDTRLPTDSTPPAWLVVTAESPPFTLDTRLPTDTTTFPNLVAQAESPPFTLDTRLPSDTMQLPNLVTQTESPAFTLDTRIPFQDLLYTNLIAMAESGPFTLDTLSGWFNTPAQTLTGGTTGGKARFAPDGLRLAKTDGSRVLLWNLQSTRTNFVFTGHAGEVATVEFSPLGDQLLTGSADGTMRWWDAASRAELGRTNPPGAGTVYAAYASDGARILAGRGANAALYRVPTMQLLQEFNGSEGSISAVAVCPEGLALAGNSARSALLWDTATGAILHRLTNHTRLITAVAFFPGGTNALTASLDGTIRIWDTATGAERMVLQQGSPVIDAALSLDGSLLVSCYDGNPLLRGNGPEGTAYIWDAESGALMRVLSDPAAPSQMKGVAISPDHTALATTYADGSVRLWDTGLAPRPIYPVTRLPIGTNAPVTLRSHGLYYFEVDAEAGRSLVLTLEADTGGGGRSKLKRSADIRVGFWRALSADAEFANLGSTATSSPRPMRLETPPPGADITAFRMTATKGHLPSVYDYESFAQASVTNLHCEMPLATSTSDKIYVLVFAPYLSAGSINARIRAEFADFHLSSITPARGGNAGNVTAQLLGTGLTPDTAARLFNAGGASITGQLALWGDSTKAWFTFVLSGAPAGGYSVEIRRPGYAAAVLTNTFTVVAGGTPLLQARLSAPAAVRPGRDYTLTLEYANAGDVDIAAPLFVVSTPTERSWLYPLTQTGPVLPLNPAQKKSQVQTMGPNPIGPVHILSPGSGNEIPIYFQGDGSVTTMPFSLGLLVANLAPVDWAGLESKLRPPDMAADLWAAIWANFRALIGTTWADYLRVLNIQAYLRLTSGQPTADVAELLASLFSEAVGAPYRRTLAAAVDASAPAPALPLQFARFTTDGLEHRFSLGPLGRGWSHNYEYTLTQPASDKVIIRTPGGGGRRFDRGSDNVWRGQAGDYATLGVGAGGFVLTEKDGLARQFDGSGLLVSIEEPNHNRVTLSYSGSQLTGLAHSAGPSFTLQYNAYGRLSRLTDHAGQVTDYEYDPAGEHLLRVIAPGAVTNTYTYQPVIGIPSDHALASIAFPDGTHQFFGWNSMGRLAEQYRDGGAERLQFTYASGGLVSVRDDRNAVTTLQLGERGQLLQMTDALGHGVTFNYDANFNLTRLTGPAGDTTEVAYDARGNPSSVINPLAQSVTLSHNGLSRLDALRDARHQLTDFGYDTGGNLTSIAYPDTSAERFSYDSAGSVATWLNRRGQNVQFTRNAQGQLTRKTYPDGHTIDYLYDGRGLLTNITDSVQGITSLSFDPRGFLTAIAYPDGKGFTFEYNAAGRRTRRVGHDGYTLNYGYDSAGRLGTLTDGASHELAHYDYDSTGRLLQETKGNGTFTTCRYDLAGQLIALTNHASLATVHSFFNYTYDAKGNRLTMTTAAGLTSYDYDALNQLTGVTYPGGRHVTYAYDAADNRTVVDDTGINTAYTANALNQYTQVGATTLGYDADGNLIRRTDSTGTTTCEYDTESRLVRVVTPANGVFQYTYDALGNRTAVVHDGVTNRFLHDPVGLVDVAAEYDASGALVARYDHAIGLVSRTDGAGNAAFYSFDALGNTRELTGDAGALLNSYDYDAFGAATVVNEMVANSYRFVGRYGVAEDSTAVFYMRARSYDAMLGRFQSMDPILFNGGQINHYGYCANNPLQLVDPTGFISIHNDRVQREIDSWVARNRGSREQAWEDLVRMRDRYPTDPALRDAEHYAWNAWNVSSAGPYGSWQRAVTWEFWTAAAAGYSGYKWGREATGIGNVTTPTWDEFYWGMKGAWDGLFLPDQPTTDAGSTESSVVRPIDPNDKIGPAGVGPNRVVSAQDEMEYMVRFENFASASAPVQELIVVDYLDGGLDWTTVRFKEIAYGDRIVTPPVGSQSFTVRDQPPTNSPSLTGSAVGHMVVDVHGMVNPQTGRVEWRVTALDTNTSLLPMDALSGILPPEDGTGRGQGYVKLGVRPKSDLPLGTAITNIATIVFDNNEPIATLPAWNMIGDVPSLAATIAYLPGQIMAGTPFTYTVGLTNTGTNLVENVVLTNALPSGVSVVSATATLGTATVTNGAVIWNLGTVTNGLGGLLTVIALPSQEGTFANTVYYSGGSGLAIYSAPSEITVIGSTRPPLAIRLLGGNVELAWPTNTAGFHLQRTSTLGPSPAWDSITNAPATVGEEFRLQFTPGAGAEFYRLIKP